MLYLEIIKALETQLQKHAQLRNLKYYRFSIPSSSVRAPFVCIPFTRVDTYTTHSNPCIQDIITCSCSGNYWDDHRLTIPILIGAARHKANDADEVLDILQDAVLKQILADRYLGGVCRLCEPSDMIVDSFFEISDQSKGAVLTLDIKFIDTPDIPDLNWIEEIFEPEYILNYDFDL